MEKTVREIIEMIDNGELHYNQSTQRKFVYAGMLVQLNCGNTTTKAGSLIYSILEEGIQLPAVYFWYNTDTNQLNIHDGKQRILSLYYFIKGIKGQGITKDHPITTRRDGKETLFVGLSEEEQNRLLDYKLDIVERSGNSLEEERSFYLINTNSVNLTNYECVSGMLHGVFLTEFESYIDKMHLDKVKPVGRGEQAYKFLLTMFNISDSKKAISNDKSILLLSNELRKVRNHPFEPTSYRFDEILNLFNELMRVVKGLKEDRALSVANYIVQNDYDADKIVYYYKSCMNKINDIAFWDVATHKTFINAYIIDDLKLDPQRYFSKDIKDTLYSKAPRCAHIDDNGHHCDEISYSKLEVDHIIPWSKGGRTVIDNARLLCKSHNASKGNRED